MIPPTVLYVMDFSVRTTSMALPFRNKTPAAPEPGRWSRKGEPRLINSGEPAWSLLKMVVFGVRRKSTRSPRPMFESAERRVPNSMRSLKTRSEGRSWAKEESKMTSLVAVRVTTKAKGSTLRRMLYSGTKSSFSLRKNSMSSSITPGTSKRLLLGSILKRSLLSDWITNLRGQMRSRAIEAPVVETRGEAVFVADVHASVPSKPQGWEVKDLRLPSAACGFSGLTRVTGTERAKVASSTNRHAERATNWWEVFIA
eukprot:28040_1